MAERIRRKAAVAGSFYPGSKEEISKEITAYLGKEDGNREVIACISPHAGWFYSGHVAGALFGSIKVPDSVILLGPNHRGIGESVAIDSADSWEFPFGEVPLDQTLANKIVSDSDKAKLDSVAHLMEHSLEVIVPFLYFKNRNIKITPVSLGTHSPEILKTLGKSIGKRAIDSGSLIVSSSDLSHFLPDDEARETDKQTIEAIKSFNPETILRLAISENALCGGAPVSTLMWAAGEMGATKAELVKYATSGDIAGSRERVVGYASFIVD